MKRLLITGYDLDFGGTEKALIQLLRFLSKKEYKITLLLQKKEGVYLKEVPSSVEIKEYRLSSSKIVPIRKIINRLHILFYPLFQKKYDISISFATYDIPSSILVKKLGKRSLLWVHSNYAHIYNKEDFYTFFSSVGVCDFDQIVFVSNEAKQDFITYYPSLKEKTFSVNNLYHFEEIKTKSLEKIQDIETHGPSLVMVGRLEEKSKGYLRMFEIMQTRPDLTLWVIGDGPDRKRYENYIKEKNCTNIHLLGARENPYPYMKQADVFVLPSYYEGFPVTVIEALSLSKKVVTTIDVSAGTFALKDYVFLCNQDAASIIKAIDTALQEEAKQPFCAEDFIKETEENTLRIIEGGTDEI